MSEQVHVLVVGTDVDGDRCIEFIGGVYANEPRIKQAIETIKARIEPDEFAASVFVDYQTFAVNCATPI